MMCYKDRAYCSMADKCQKREICYYGEKINIIDLMKVNLPVSYFQPEEATNGDCWNYVERAL